MKIAAKMLSTFLVVVMFLSICSCNAEQPDLPETLPPDVEIIDTQKDTPSISDTTIADTTSPQIPETVDVVTGAVLTEKKSCVYHRLVYHDFFPKLITEEEYEEWKEFMDASYIGDEVEEGQCPRPDCNIYEFIHRYNIPKEYLIEEYNNGYWVSEHQDYDIELLYGDDPEACEQYYVKEYYYNIDGKTADLNKRRNFGNLKFYIFTLWDVDNEVRNENKNSSIAERFLLSGATIEQIEERIEFYKQRTISSGKEYHSYDYNLDLLRMSEAELRELIDTKTPFYIDCLFCNITPYDTPYEKQLAEKGLLP